MSATRAPERVPVPGLARAAGDAPHACVHHLFEAQAARTPGRVAVEADDGALTYAELDRRAAALAAVLAGRGVGPGSRVGVFVERTAEMPVALLGVLKAGGAYVPLDPAYPADRVAYVLADSGAGVLVTQPGLRDRLPEFGGEVVEVGGEPPYPPGPPPPPRGGEGLGEGASLAYVIYTSGSTGRPKGVMVPHGAVVNFLHTMRERPGLGEDDVLLAVTTLSFDIAGLELFLPLTVGAKVVVAGRETASDARLLAERLAGCGATVMQATPATWRMLLDSGWEGDPGLRALCGGEAL
ncbi:MAG TPA: AMP-binding protein, partial [Longimicrobiaceae bacterium]|nr:AMP-binding protein [Longimicrobiaceae bacterium]